MAIPLCLQFILGLAMQLDFSVSYAITQKSRT